MLYVTPFCFLNLFVFGFFNKKIFFLTPSKEQIRSISTCFHFFSFATSVSEKKQLVLNANTLQVN